LANHGVFVVGKDIAQAHHRAVVLEWRCRQAWHVEALGGGVEMHDEVFKRFSKNFDYVSFPGLWEAMVRRELRNDPSIVD
jgi:ribulose-5-phosphate 4-epimerase/fuculose-1-phosphate aldolase